MSLGKALEWWLRDQNKFDGARVETKDGVITSWDANGVTQPTDVEITTIITNYEASVVSEKDSKKQRKRQLLDALATLTGLTRKQVLKCFNEIVQDRTDD